MKLAKDTLFIIGAPFEDAEYPGKSWFCRDCATMEGAFLVNPGWAEAVDLRRLAYARPRHDVIEVLGEENQSLPALVIADPTHAPEGALQAANGKIFLTEARAILRYLTNRYGGVGQHP